MSVKPHIPSMKLKLFSFLHYLNNLWVPIGMKPALSDFETDETELSSKPTWSEVLNKIWIRCRIMSKLLIRGWLGLGHNLLRISCTNLYNRTSNEVIFNIIYYSPFSWLAKIIALIKGELFDCIEREGNLKDT